MIRINFKNKLNCTLSGGNNACDWKNRKYIQEQKKHDIEIDKLSVKEYEDPFKGGQ